MIHYEREVEYIIFLQSIIKYHLDGTCVREFAICDHLSTKVDVCIIMSNNILHMEENMLYRHFVRSIMNMTRA